MTPRLHRTTRALLIAALTAGGILGLVLVGWQLGRPSLFRETARREPAAAFELSVFDQPRTLPEIHFADEKGHQLTLADFRGRVVLLNVWATWCLPCREEMPALDRLQAMLGGKEFLVVPLSIDRQGAAAVKRFYQERSLEKLGIYIDPSGRASRGLAVPGLPTTLLIDREGREVARKMGAAEWDSPEMLSLIRPAIEKGQHR